MKIILFLLSPFLFLAASLPKLSDYGMNVYSQFGEDGILRKIFELIGERSRIAVEFGATDGFFCSNTANLWTKNPNWKAILIEADSSNFSQLKKNTASFPNCTVLHRKVGISRYDSIESILAEIGVQETIDLMSIDIDGNDYYILQSLNQVRPRVIVTEYNPSIPAHLDIYPEPGNYIGCSVAALQRVASQLGYSLVSITDTNCIFVLSSEFDRFSGFDTDREHIRVDRYISYIISDYAGNHKVVGQQGFVQPWGWTRQQSSYPIHGNIIELMRTVISP